MPYCNTPDPSEGVVKLVTARDERDYSSPFVGSRHVGGDRASSSALIRIVRGVIILEWGTLVLLLLSPVYLSCLRVVATRKEPSPLLTTRYGSGMLPLYPLSLS